MRTVIRFSICIQMVNAYNNWFFGDPSKHYIGFVSGTDKTSLFEILVIFQRGHTLISTRRSTTNELRTDGKFEVRVVPRKFMEFLNVFGAKNRTTRKSKNNLFLFLYILRNTDTFSNIPFFLFAFFVLTDKFLRFIERIFKSCIILNFFVLLTKYY